MMEVVIENGKQFADLVAGLSNIFEEVLFKFAPDGLELRAMDVSRVVLVSLKIPNTAFEKYDVDKTYKIGVELDKLKKVMNRVKSKDKVILKSDEKFLNVEICGSMRRRFMISLIELEELEFELPELSYTAKAEITPEIFKEIIKDVELVSDTVKIVGTNEFVKFIAEGETSEVEIKLTLENNGLLDIAVEGDEVACLYGVSFLKDIAKLVKAGGQDVMLKWGEEIPIEFEFSIFGDGKVQILLAPRVE